MKSNRSHIHFPGLISPAFVTAVLAAACIVLGGAPAQANPTISSVSPSGAVQFQGVPNNNKLTFTAASGASGGVTNVNVSLSWTNLQGYTYASGTLSTINGLTLTGTPASYAVSAPLANDTVYTAVISATDSAGTTTTTVTFDTINPNYYTFEAEDWDYVIGISDGCFDDNPQTNAYYRMASTSGIDYKHTSSGNTNYRAAGLNTETNSDTPRAQYASGLTDYDVGWNTVGDWGNYTRTYPSGLYNVYCRISGSTATANAISIGLVTSGAGTSTQITNEFGILATRGLGWQVYNFAPCLDNNNGGQLAAWAVPPTTDITTGARTEGLSASGDVETVRFTVVGGNCNENFYMLVPAAPVLSPTNTVLYVGNPGPTLSMDVRSLYTATYQWQTDNGSGGVTWSAIPGATSASYTGSTASAGVTEYRLQVTVDGMPVYSLPVTLTVNTHAAPVIVQNPTPSSVTVNQYAGTTLTASFTGTAPITNQWYVSANGGPFTVLTNQNNTTLLLSDYVAGTFQYELVAGNPIGYTTSAVATVTVNAGPMPIVNFDVAGGESGGVNYSGQGAYADLSANTYWNPAKINGTTPAATNSDGHTVSAVTLTEVQGGTATDGSAVPSGTPTAFEYKFSLESGYAVGTCSLNNVVPGTYQLYLYGKNGNYNDCDRGTTFTVYVGSVATGTLVGSLSTTNVVDSVFTLYNDYVLFDGVTVPPGTTTISFTYKNNPIQSPKTSDYTGTNNEGEFNGVQLVFSPPGPPSVTQQPAAAVELISGATAHLNSTAYCGTNAAGGYWQMFDSAVTGTWTNLANSAAISGATGTVSNGPNQVAALTITLSAATAGSYRAFYTNGLGSGTASAASVVSVYTPAPGGFVATAAAIPGLAALWPLNETNDPSAGTVTAFDIISGYNGFYNTNAQNGGINTKLPAVLSAAGLGGNVSPVQGPATVGYTGLPATAFAPVPNLANSLITVPKGPGVPLSNTNMTIVAWVNSFGWNYTPGIYCIILTEAGGALGVPIHGYNGLEMNVNPPTSSGVLQGAYDWDDDDAGCHLWVSGATIPTNLWTMYALTISPSNGVLYLANANGFHAFTNSFPNTNEPWGGGFQIGGNNSFGGSPSNTFGGAISSVAMFTNTLSYLQLSNLFASGMSTGLPLIASQPASTAVYPGNPAQFTVTAYSSAPLYYNWQRSGTNLVDQGNISGSATATLNLASVSTADVTNYDVVVSNSYGAVTSSVAALTLILTPEILSQPVPLAVGFGQTAQLTVSATAGLTLSYQWKAGAIGSGVYTNLSNGGNISGANSQTLTISDPGEGNQADYIVVVGDAAGQVISSVATLTLNVMTWEEAGQGGPVTAVATSPDGAWIASGSEDGTVKIWHASSGGLARTLAASGLLPVSALAFGPGGTNIAAGYYDGTIRLWNTANGALIQTFNMEWTDTVSGSTTGKYTNYLAKISSLDFSPNGQQLAAGCGDWYTRIWQISTATVLNKWMLFNGDVLSLAYSPDGTMLAVSGESTNTIKNIVVLNTTSWATLATLHQGSNNVVQGSNNVTSVAFSPQGNLLVTGCLDQTICFWSTANWSLQRTRTNSGAGITSLAFATNGQTLFAGDESGVITPWVASGGWNAGQSWAAHTGAVWSLACTADSTLLVSGGDDHLVRIWQTANGSLVTNLISHTAGISRVSFAPDGSMVASAGTDASVRLWAAQTGASAYVLAAHTNQVSALAFSPDATFMVSGGGCLDNNICLWSCSNGGWLQTIGGLFTNGVTTLAVSPDTTLIASGGDRSEQVIQLWSRTGGNLVHTFPGHTNGTGVLAFSPNGRYLASGGMYKSGSIKLWDLSNDSLSYTFNGHTCSVVSLSFNPTGTLLASAGQKDGLINIWTNGSVTPLRSLSSMASGARAVAFSPDGTLLAAGGSDTIQMWQTSNLGGGPVWSCASEMVGISALNFSPNGTFLVFGRDDGTVGQVWNPMAAPVQLWLGATQAGHFTIANPSYSPYLTVQTSSDLSLWNVLTNLVTVTNMVQVTDPSPSSNARFYRVTTPQ